MDAGRYIAAERGAFDPPEPAEEQPQAPERFPLVERLSADSLAALAAISGVTVAELIRRQA